MSLAIKVGLLSGRMVSLEVGPHESVEELRTRAQKTLAVGRGRLFDSCGSVLDEAATLEQSAVHSGDTLTLQIRRVHVLSNGFAFAALLGDASVVTWGNPHRGGDSTAVKDRLKNVQQIQATESAFAAILGDGSVVTWGEADEGGHQ